MKPPPLTAKPDSLGRRILEVLRDCPATVEELAVVCWQRWPWQFGLRKYEGQFPDSNRVIACLASYSGPVRRGWVRKIAEKTYEITELGRRILATREPENE